MSIPVKNQRGLWSPCFSKIQNLAVPIGRAVGLPGYRWEDSEFRGKKPLRVLKKVYFLRNEVDGLKDRRDVRLRVCDPDGLLFKLNPQMRFKNRIVDAFGIRMKYSDLRVRWRVVVQGEKGKKSRGGSRGAAKGMEVVTWDEVKGLRP